MIRSLTTSLVRLYRIRATPMYAITRTHWLIPSSLLSYSTIVRSTGRSSYCIVRRIQREDGVVTATGIRTLSQQLSSDVVSDNSNRDNNDNTNGVSVSITKSVGIDHNELLQPKGEIRTAACGDVTNNNDDESDNDEMEQEEMFVEAHESFGHNKKEWGGPRRGGRLPEPTRFGDWERNGRCSDF